MIRVVIFDVMGVIFKVSDDVQDLLVPYVLSLKPSTPKEFIIEKYMEASLGKISSHELWVALGFPESDVQAVERDYLEKYIIDEEFFGCARRLKARYRLALLSNDVSEWSAFLRRKFRIDSLIEKAFISGEMGLRKPDPRIYQKAIQDLEISGNECIFVDDYPERVEAAGQQGMIPVLFNRQGYVYHGLQVRSFDELAQLLV